MNDLSVSSTDTARSRNIYTLDNNRSYYHSRPANSVPQPPAQGSDGMSKTLPIVSSAVALASLGVAAYSIVKMKGVKNVSRQLETISKDISESKKSVKDLTETVNTVKTNTEKGLNELRGEISSRFDGVKGELKGEISQQIGDVRGEINNVRRAVQAPSGGVSDLFTRPVNINGAEYSLSSVMHGYGIHEQKLTEQLRGEATRRTLGAIKPNPLPENAMIRVPSAEFQGFTKTGGLAVVPRELIGNLGAVVNNKQKMELIADTPLYLGQVENNQFFSIVKNKDGKYDYIKKEFKEKIIKGADGKETKAMTGEEKVMTRLTKIDEMVLPIHTDGKKTTEHVEVYLSDELLQSVPYEETMLQFEADTAKQISESMSKGKDFETPLVRFIAPKSASAKIGIGKEKPVKVDYDEVLNTVGGEKASEIRASLEIGKEYKLPISEYIAAKGGNRHEALKMFDKKTTDLINNAIDTGKDIPNITFVPPVPAEAKVKFRTVFYKNDKFRMDGPVNAGATKNIYNNNTIQSGETERNVYFCKYMYENLVRNHETSDKPLRADWIIGNDWHTGALSAMTRLLTPAKKAMGMEPEAADKLYNTPITTLMHNFKLQGTVWHSQGKLLNVMFGEHAAKVAENAWMPQKADMPGTLMNGLFSGKDLNPQTMAMAYSDDIVFVSRGNFTEATTIGEKGGTNYQLASLRARTYQYADRKRLDDIAMASGIRPDEVGQYPTAKGITNGCDRVNNIITKQKARKLEEDLNLPLGSVKSAEEAIKDPFGVHQNNKAVYLQRVRDDINLARTSSGKENPMLIYDYEHTDLTGVDENTPVFGMAGRIVDQKGIDIWSEGIKKFYQRGHYDKANPPVFYLQGKGDDQFIEKYLQAKSSVREIDSKAADRIVFAKLFSEKGRYDGCKMMSDFDGMPSWDEPCGLVHKEIGYNSGAISIVNKVGGLTDGLKPYTKAGDNKGANSIFVDFMDKDTHKYDDAISYNGEKTADAFETALEWYKDKAGFAQGIESSYKSRHDWLSGKIQEYVELGKRHGVIAESVDSHYTV
ncbi:MAG: glycogen/starch synthase [Candidatus Gastranaerophilales bacterium]|nr:glycogen/starch synthase [Candidatus Gastranaerophilales bacterium]